MRSAVLLALLAVLFLIIPAQSAMAQEMIEQPTYSPGDFWTYDISAPGVQEFLGGADENLTTSIEFTTRVEGTEDRMIGGTTVSVYNTTYSVEASISWSGEFEFFDMNTTSISLTSSVTSDVSVYLDTDGLEILQVSGTFSFGANVSTVVEGVTLSFPVQADGSLDATMDYTVDTWSFPIQEGNQGSEEFQATAEASFRTLFLGNETTNTTSLELNSSAFYKVNGPEMVTVPAGTFDTLVVNSTAEEEGVSVGYELAYWSPQAGGPVKREAYNEDGQLLASLNLTGYRYQTAERLTILGLDIIYWIPIGVGAAVLVGVVVWIVTRRRP